MWVVYYTHDIGNPNYHIEIILNLIPVMTCARHVYIQYLGAICLKPCKPLVSRRGKDVLDTPSTSPTTI